MVKKIFKFIKSIIRGIINFFPWYAKLYKGRAWYTKTAVGVVSFIVAIFLYLGMVDINFLWLFGKSPGFIDIKTPPTYAASEIYSADSVLIGRFYKENRTPVKYEEVNPAFGMHSLVQRMNASIAIMELTLWVSEVPSKTL